MTSYTSIGCQWVYLKLLRANAVMKKMNFWSKSAMVKNIKIFQLEMITSFQLTMETLKEFDWCLGQLDTLKASMSISEMASNKVSMNNWPG